MIFSQYNKVVNALEPKADRFATAGNSDVISMKKYKHITFLIMTGASSTADGTVTVEACDDTTPSNQTAIAFKYRAITTGDTYGALTAATAAGFSMTASKVNSYYIVEVDAADIEAGQAGYEYVRLVVTEVTDDPQIAGIVAILSQPRHAYEQLATVLT